MMTDWDNTYSRLPNQMYAQQMPTPVTSPSGLALIKKLNWKNKKPWLDRLRLFIFGSGFIERLPDLLAQPT